MPEEPLNQPQNNSPSNGPTPAAEVENRPLPSLRETIESAYDAEPETTEGGQAQRNRDTLGRFAAKDVEPGEAEPRAPSPEKPITEAQPKAPDPAPAGSSNQAPEHWSAEVKADFDKLPPEGKAILLKRHAEMEADYTRKSQAASGAVQFSNTLAPVFNDPDISRSMRENGLTPVQAIQTWAEVQKRALNPDVRERVSLLVDLSQRMGLDPARLFATASPQPVPGLRPEDQNDPAIRYFADHLGRTTSEIQTLRNELQQMRQAERQQREDESLKATRWGIDQFAAEAGADGRPLRPYFDAVLEDVIELFKANPERDLQDAYERAIWANPQVRAHMLTQQQQVHQSQNAVERAKLAARGNTRGMTSPVSKPTAQKGNGSLRDTLESSADEVGF